MICPKCGRQLRDTASICSYCGCMLEKENRRPSQAAADRTRTAASRKRRKQKKTFPFVAVGVVLAVVVVALLMWAAFRTPSQGGNGNTFVTTTPLETTVATATTTAPSTTTTVKLPEDPSVQPPGYNKTAQPQEIGYVLVVGDSAFEYYNYVDSLAVTYTAAVNSTAAKLGGTATVYDMIIPTSMDICLDASVREGIGVSDQREAIDTMYAQLSSGVKAVGVFDALYQSNAQNDYCYFRTDHHWTALGAYRAYEQFALAKGITATPLSSFVEHRFPGYLGYFYYCTDYLSALSDNPDVVIAYEPKQTNTITVTDMNGATYDTDIIVDKSDSDYDTKYLTFIGGDTALGVIHNPERSDGSACVLVKESFGNAFAPFLVAHYQTVYVVDYRYFANVYSGSLADFVREKGAQDVIFLNNTSATRNEDLMQSLSALCG